jgi:predicted SAM-dependent methyltransferase
VAEEWREAYAGDELPVNWIIGFCFAFHREMFDVLGEFDESMWPSSGEELDFCLRARHKQYEVGIARDVYVHHEGSVTFRDMQKNGLLVYNDLCDATTENLKKKWGDFWNQQHVRAPGNGGLRINLGCGRFHLPGFINVDQDESVKPDIVGDVLDLPYGEETVDEIYAGHVLEHFDWVDGVRALRHWRSVLKTGGRISVSVPDFDVVASRYLKNPDADALRDLNDTYVYSCRQKSPHKYAYSAALLKQVMAEAGFAELKRMPVDHPYFPEAVDWQVGIEAVKS